MPKVKASGVQRGLKDSVMNDMCNAVARQMIGDLYVSCKKQGTDDDTNYTQYS